MGYRSTVKCAFVFTDEFVRDAFFVSSMVNAEAALAQEFKDSMTEIPDHIKQEVEWFRDSFTSCVLAGNPVLLLEMDDIKWYESFWFVKFTTEMQEECVNRGGGYRFIRLGEESDDQEINEGNHENFDDFNGYDYLDISREIVIQ